MDKGTIVLTKFPFTDLSGAKRRPAVIISKVDPTNTDVIVAFISSAISPISSLSADFVLPDSHPISLLQASKRLPFSKWTNWQLWTSPFLLASWEMSHRLFLNF